MTRTLLLDADQRFLLASAGLPTNGSHESKALLRTAKLHPSSTASQNHSATAPEPQHHGTDAPAPRQRHHSTSVAQQRNTNQNSLDANHDGHAARFRWCWDKCHGSREPRGAFKRLNSSWQQAWVAHSQCSVVDIERELSGAIEQRAVVPEQRFASATPTAL